MGYDPYCEELAYVFQPVGAPKKLAAELAQEIQDAIERWMEARGIGE